MEKISKYNKYGILSGGFIFDLLDKQCAELAFTNLGDCLTINSYINYYFPIQELEDTSIECNVVGYTSRSSTVEAKIFLGEELAVLALFSFVKKK